MIHHRLHLADPYHGSLRIVTLLRLLARLEFMPERYLHQLLAPQLSRRHYRRILADAHAQRLIWRHEVSARHLPGHMLARGNVRPPKNPVLFGLTEEGRTWLQRERVEGGNALELAIVHHWRDPDLKTGHLKHDLLVVDWCCRALAELRRSGRLAAVEIVLENETLVATRETPGQRMDALMLIRLAEQPRQWASPGAFPWGWGGKRTPRQISWALEIDRDTEHGGTLTGKAIAYRDRSINGHYQQAYGVNPLPVIVTTTPRRAEKIAREWSDGWPGGRGAIASFAQISDAQGGVLWGNYSQLEAGLTRPVTLWNDTGVTRAMWEEWCAARPETG